MPGGADRVPEAGSFVFGEVGGEIFDGVAGDED